MNDRGVGASLVRAMSDPRGSRGDAYFTPDASRREGLAARQALSSRRNPRSPRVGDCLQRRWRPHAGGAARQPWFVAAKPIEVLGCGVEIQVFVRWLSSEVWKETPCAVDGYPVDVVLEGETSRIDTVH